MMLGQFRRLAPRFRYFCPALMLERADMEDLSSLAICRP